MGTIRAYFRQHPWQRRLASGLAALLLGVIVAILTLPTIREALTIRDLASRDVPKRQKAISDAANSARQSTASLRRLTDALDSGDDLQFTGVVAALRKIGRFDQQHVNGVYLDHWACLELLDIRSPQVAATVLQPVILCERDNQYVRRCASLAATSDSPAIRELAAVLAARLGDNEILRKLLTDADASVASAAALDAGLANRTALAGDLRKCFDQAASVEVVSSAAYALARLAPADSSQAICQRLLRTDDDRLADRLLHVMTILNDHPADDAVRQVLLRKPFPPAMALSAAGRMKIAQADAPARAVLVAAAHGDARVSVEQTLGALQAIDALGLPARREVYDICQNLWTADVRFRLMLSKAAQMLARQALQGQDGQPNPPSVQECMDALSAAGQFVELPFARVAGVPPARDADILSAKTSENDQTHEGTMPSTHAASAPTSQYIEPGLPVASAVAAVAGWELSLAMPNDPVARLLARDSVLQATRQENAILGDIVASRLAHAQFIEQAFSLGLTMLPAANAPPELRVYSEHERAAGALTLAMTARTPAQITQATQRITERLEHSEGVYDLNMAYRCSLLMLGLQENAAPVWDALQLGAISPRRALAALAWAGDKRAMDWLLWNRQVSDYLVIVILLPQGLEEILSTTCPHLAVVDSAAEYDLQAWQVRIMRDDWAIHRATMTVGANAK